MRELEEELGLKNVKLFAESKVILLYDWPEELQQKYKKRGQIRKLFWCEYSVQVLDCSKKKLRIVNG